MTLSLGTVAEVGDKSKDDLLGVKFPQPPVATLQDIATASGTLVMNLGQWYALGGLRQNAEALQALIVENELALVPGYRIECQISTNTNAPARARRTQTVYVRAVAI